MSDLYYRSVVDAIALKTLQKRNDVPDYHLMVGDAEDLSSKPIMIFEEFMPKQTAKYLPNTSEMTYEDVQQNLASGKLTIDDFFANTYSFGDPIM